MEQELGPRQPDAVGMGGVEPGEVGRVGQVDPHADRDAVARHGGAAEEVGLAPAPGDLGIAMLLESGEGLGIGIERDGPRVGVDEGVALGGEDGGAKADDERQAALAGERRDVARGAARRQQQGCGAGPVDRVEACGAEIVGHDDRARRDHRSRARRRPQGLERGGADVIPRHQGVGDLLREVLVDASCGIIR